jgi:hypothetical protein
VNGARTVECNHVQLLFQVRLGKQATHADSALMQAMSRGRPISVTVRKNVIGTIWWSKRRTRCRHAVFDSGIQLRRSRPRGSFDGYRNGGTQSSGSRGSFDPDALEADPLVAIAGAGGVALFDSMGNAWTATSLKVTGDLAVDLRSNIAAEARAKIVYERLLRFTQDKGSKQTLQSLMTCEITHMRAFTAALESMEKPQFSVGIIEPTPHLVDQYFNASTGESEYGEKDFVGPWNHSNGLLS